MVQLSKVWEDLHTSLWFIPALIIAGSVGLAAGLLEVDERLDPQALREWPGVFSSSAEGARTTLSAIATSVMTVAGVSFSVTIVALSLAASQYSSRVLRTFLRDRANQTVLGALLGVFAYCLVVLQSVRDGTDQKFVPPLATLTAVLSGFVAIGFLIFFIHHIATSIQVSSILATIREDTSEAVRLLFPDPLGETDEETEESEHRKLVAAHAWHAVPARETGYIQRVDAEGFLAFARKRNAIVRMEYGIGEFVIAGTPLASVAKMGEPDAAAVKSLNAIYSIGRFPTVEQDAGFGIRQMVDMALKALSPGVNDTTSAVMGVEYLTAILVMLADRRIESPFRVEGGELRVVTRGPTFESLLALAFDQIRQNAGGNVAVLMQMLNSLQVVVEVASSPDRRRALRVHADAILEVIQRTVPAPRDRKRLEDAAAQLAGRLAPAATSDA